MIVAASSSKSRTMTGMVSFFCQLTGSVPPVSGYQLITALRVWSSNRRNQNAILLDTVCGFHHGFVILDFEWVVLKGMQFRQVVVLPTPPFWLAMAMICVFMTSPHF